MGSKAHEREETGADIIPKCCDIAEEDSGSTGSPAWAAKECNEVGDSIEWRSTSGVPPRLMRAFSTCFPIRNSQQLHHPQTFRLAILPIPIILLIVGSWALWVLARLETVYRY